MFRILCYPSSGSTELCLTEITRSDSLRLAGPYTHTHHRFKITLPKHRPSTRQNICESLRVISVKHSSVLPDDGSHRIWNVSEWFLILCLLNFYTTYILTSKFCIIECISQKIKVIDYNNAWWKHEITILGVWIKMCQEITTVVEAGQIYRALYVKTKVHFIIAGNIKLPSKHSLWVKRHQTIRIPKEV